MDEPVYVKYYVSPDGTEWSSEDFTIDQLILDGFGDDFFIEEREITDGD
jgi:hypothetical protein